MKKELDVVAALIRQDDKFLLCQRKEDDEFAMLWEFPGGCVEEKEELPCAIEREIKEELDLEIKADCLLRDFCDEDEMLKIKVYLFSCFIKGGIPKARECRDFGFFTLAQTEELNLAPVDRKIFDYLHFLFSSK